MSLVEAESMLARANSMIGPMKLHELVELVKACTYKPGWSVVLLLDLGRPYIQVNATTLCSVTLKPSEWKSGKTYLSIHMCRQEVIAAVYGAIEKAELHEVREFFRYKGASIFNPHLDPDVLAEVARKRSSFNLMENAMSMDEGRA
jgi:hypothetical protein